VRKRFVVALLLAAVIVGFVVAKRHELIRFTIEGAASAASGYGVRYANQLIGFDHAALTDVHVSSGGYPLLDARRIDIYYSLRDLLPGSTRRFGFAGLAIDDGKVTLVHYRNGTYNINVPAAARAPGWSGPPVRERTNPVPIRFNLTMHNAQLELLEPYAYDTSAKDVRVHDFNVEASVDTAGRTHYSATGSFAELKSSLPFSIVGTIDARRGYAMHHAKASRFPLRALANYFADTPAVRILAGGAHNFDARLYSLDVQPNEPSSYHANLQVDLQKAKIAFTAIDAPIENISGHLELVDNAVFVRDLSARLAGVPLHASGGLFDLTGDLTGSPQLRLGVYGSGDLADLRNAFKFTAKEPIRGTMNLGVLVEGPLDNPLIVARGRAPDAYYQKMPLDSIDANIMYYNGRVALLPLHAYYAGTEVGARGYFDIAGPHVLSTLAVHVVASAQRLPYLDELLGDEPVLLDAVANGTDLLFHMTGAFASARGENRIAGIVGLERNGIASIDPFWIHTERGNMDGGYSLDRPHDRSAFWATASNLTLHAPRYPTFPGVELPQMPKIEGSITGLAVAGGGPGKNPVLAGTMSGRNANFAGVAFDNLSAAFGGSFSDAAVNLLHASGPWGTFDGSGAFSTQTFVARGAYRGTFEGLQPFLGNAFTAHGPIAGAVAIAVEPRRIVVQGQNLAMPGATLRGVPVDHASLTLAVVGDRIDIYSAHAQAAGGDVVVAGTYSTGAAPAAWRATAARGTLSLVANRLNAAQLRGIGLPIESGQLNATGNLAAGAPLPSFKGGVTIAGGRMQHYPLSGSTDVDLAANGVALTHTVGQFGRTVTLVNGRIDALSSGSPTYDLDATVPAAGVASALHTLELPNFMTDGTFNARLRIGGSGGAPHVAGNVNVPGGDVNGLPFIDASAVLAAGTGGVTVHHGRVLVGTTHVHFSGTTQAGANAAHVAADRADLSDFNNFFDTGDTLDGNGALRLAASQRGGRISTSGNIDVKKFRYRNLPLGDIRADWTSARNKATGAIDVGGAEGTLRAKGSITFTPESQLQALLENARYDLSGSVENLDLSLWVAALGFPNIPVTGRAGGNVVVKGRYPLLALHGNAEIGGGTIGPLTLDTAKLAVHSSGTRITIDSSQLETQGLSATALGSLGLGPADPIDLQVHATTKTLPELIYQLTRTKIPVTGTFDSTLQVGGTFKAPTFAAGIKGTGVVAYGITVASLFGEVHLRGRSLQVSDAGATFTQGQATLAGSLPLEIAPFRIGPDNAPVNFDLNVTNLNPSLLDGLLANNTKLSGRIDGHVGLSGTVQSPQIVGHIALANGAYVSDLERTPITQTVATLTFNRTSASIDHFAGHFGSGTIGGSGQIEFPDGFETSGKLAFEVKANAQGAQLDLPAYGSGTLDAAVVLDKRPAQQAVLSGKVTLRNATLPFSAFITAAASGTPGGGPPLPLAFNLEAVAGKAVRVRGSGYGAGLDIGTTGAVRLGGTLAAPTLDGTFTSTGGTLTYFDRAFKVQKGSVSFNASDGVLPNLHAVAVTNVINPDPDRARNPIGSANITISVNGPIEGLKIDFSSSPPGYTRDQIIALMAPLGGYISGMQFGAQSALQVQSPGGFTPLGALQPIPGVNYSRTNSTVTVGQEAFSILNAQFAAGLMSPVETALGQGLGLSSVNLTLGYYGNVGFTATRELGKSFNAVYSTTFGTPQIQSFGLQYQPVADTSATMSFFTQSGPSRLFQTPGATVYTNQSAFLGEPLQGNNGFSVILQRRFW
jgi:autotransporter translocation and assembly factor TamB